MDMGGEIRTRHRALTISDVQVSRLQSLVSLYLQLFYSFYMDTN